MLAVTVLGCVLCAVKGVVIVIVIAIADSRRWNWRLKVDFVRKKQST
jgi:hypothetical protein